MNRHITRISAFLILLLAALSIWGCVRATVESEPSGAKLYLNGRYMGTTPYVGDVFIPEGIGSLTAAVLPGYELSDCAPIARSPGGLPPPIAFTSAPAGALFYKNGQYAGTSPGYDALPGLVQHVRIVWPKEVLEQASKHHPGAQASRHHPDVQDTAGPADRPSGTPAGKPSGASSGTPTGTPSSGSLEPQD